MSAEVLFQTSFGVAAPFWALMILAPTWRWTYRVASSPLIVLPALTVCLVAYLPVMGPLWTLVVDPSLGDLAGFVADPRALAGVWAQIIAWDLVVGRWIYLDSRARGVPPLLMAPVMVFAVLLSPVALPLYFVLRQFFRTATSQADVAPASTPAAPRTA